jgi:ferric-dicitrate binding protein FerR (iron transport regulator)
MTDPKDTGRLALELLASTPIAPAPVAIDARDRAIAVAVRAMEQRRARRRRRANGAALLMSAAAIALVVFGLSLRRGRHDPPPIPTIAAAAVTGDVHVRRDGRDALLTAASMLAAGDRVVAGVGAHADLALSSGTEIGLASSGELEVTAIGSRQVFSVLAGSAHFHVAKLMAGQEFLVRTVDAEVTVRGTTFDVALVPEGWSCPGGERTQVTVSEGVVLVRHAGLEVRLDPGARWPVGCAPTTPVPAPPPIATATTVATPVSTGAPPATSTPPKIAPKSALQAQNDLLAQALAEKRSGNRAAALAAYDSFLVKYPSSGLAEVAMVERMRLLSGASAVQAANAYLARYPAGFARAEAKKIAAGP